jgi:hypothetical protein
MPETEPCPHCGGAIPADAPEKLCPRCLLAPLSEVPTLSRSAGEPAPTSTLAAGDVLGRYRLVQMLGRGGFGEVWEAEDVETGRHTALKLLLEARDASGEAMERFEREGRLAASLNHPRCVYVFLAERVDGFPVISMELMAGGTLQDRIRRDGPLPYRTAVDHVLDVIDGLEAARAAGILHRDVKPSNCFLDADGRTKIGDFGLSKGLEDEALLTSAGGFVGTPSYASPEQVRGAEMDTRSDIYSVGATLYALISGHPPFRARAATEVLARILADEPPALDVPVPDGLERIVRRTLAKNREERYPTYTALRAALLPFATGGLTTAGLTRRLGAMFIDSTLLALPWLLVSSRLTWTSSLMAAWVTKLLYFWLTEGLWGQSVGKHLLGLRVVDWDDRPAGLARTFLRTALFMAAQPAGAGLSILGLSGGFPAGMQLVCAAVLLATMRERNGFAGLHEVWSGTRVRTAALGVKTVSTNASTVVDSAAPATPRRFGPYIESRPIWERSSEGLLVAWDPILRRNAWIHWFGPEHAKPTPAQLASPSAARLRWLQGTRTGDLHWDAYETPAGATVLARVRDRGPVSWAELRRLLRATVEAIRQLRDDDAPVWLSVSRVWIDAHGAVKVLDFPVTRDGEEERRFALEEWSDFLRQLVRFALLGRLETRAPGAEPSVPLPEYARPLLARLCGDEPPFAEPGDLVAELAALEARPAKVSRERRLAALLPTAGPVAMGLASVALLTMLSHVPELEPAATAVASLARAGRVMDLASRRDAARVLIASNWERVPPRLHDLALAVVRPGDRRLVEDAVRSFPDVTPAQVASAEQTLGLEPGASRRVAFNWARVLQGAIHWLRIVGLLALPFAALKRGGLGLDQFGIAVQRGDGRPAGRGRCLFRALIAWSPVLVLLVWLPSRGALFQAAAFAAPVALALMAAGAGYSLWRPERGLQDLLAGTWLVPR